MATITDYYAEPWSAWDLNLRDWYHPELIISFMQRSYLSQMVPLRVDPAAMGTKKLIWTGLYPLEPNWNSIDNVSWWLEKMVPTGYRVEVEMETYGGGMGLHKYHPLVTFWKRGGGTNALAQITRDFVADAMVRQIEQQVLNAYLTKPHVYITGQASGSGVGDLTANNTYDVTKAHEVGLDFEYMYTTQPGQIPTQVAYLSPGQAYAIRKDSTNWITPQQYTEFGIRRVMNWEVGAYVGVGRYLRHPINTLYNFGTLAIHCNVKAAINPGDGAPDPSTTTIDGARRVGQITEGTPTRYIQLGTTAGDFDVGWDTDIGTTMAKFLVGDIVTIHTVESPGTDSLWNVQYAPLPSDGTICYRQIVSVDTANARLAFDKPIVKNYTIDGQGDCDAGEYAFVSKGLHIHVALHMAKPGGVVGAFADPPKLMFPAPFDDRQAQYRVTWDGVYGYRLFQPENYHVILSAGYVSARTYMRKGNETS